MLKFEKATNQSILDLKNWVLNNKRLSNNFALSKGLDDSNGAYQRNIDSKNGTMYEKLSTGFEQEFQISSTITNAHDSQSKFRVSQTNQMHPNLNKVQQSRTKTLDHKNPRQTAAGERVNTSNSTSAHMLKENAARIQSFQPILEANSGMPTPINNRATSNINNLNADLSNVQSQQQQK